MRKQCAAETKPTISVSIPAKVVNVLHVCPIDADHLSLEAIVSHSTWKLFKSCDLKSALTLLQQRDIAVVLCDRELLPEKYGDVLEHINAMPSPPSLIVASRLADERLWAEALNLGAWDVLSKPFDRSEVIRTVKSGWQHWYDQIQGRTTAGKVMSAAS
jgi:DNA-binding NtrC family response regulator